MSEDTVGLVAKQRKPSGYWTSHLRRWEAEGGTLKEYAEANGLPVQSLYRTRTSERHKQRTKRGATNGSTPTFVPVRVSAAPTTTPIRVELTNGVAVELPAGTDEATGRWVLAAASQRS